MLHHSTAASILNLLTLLSCTVLSVNAQWRHQTKMALTMKPNKTKMLSRFDFQVWNVVCYCQKYKQHLHLTLLLFILEDIFISLIGK